MGASRRPAPPSVDWVLPPCVVGILRHYRETVDSRWMFPSPVKEDVPMTLGGGALATPDHSGAGRVQKNQISRFTPTICQAYYKKYILQKQKSQTVKCDGMGFLFFNFWIVESNLVFYTDLNGFILCI